MVEVPAAPAAVLKDDPTVDHSGPGPSRPKKTSTVDQMRADLDRLGLDSKGKKATLWKRLVKAFQRAMQIPASDSESEPEPAQPPPNGDTDFPVRQPKRGNEKARAERWKAFLCFDVEATCRGGKEFAWPNEIIEFPVVLLKWAQDPAFDDRPDPLSNPQIPASLRYGTRRLERIDTFHSYIKPTWQPKLEDFCVALTGITQEMVDKSPKFVQMLPVFEEWLDKHGLLDDDGKLQNTMWVTDGPWDLRDFIPKQLHISPPASGPPPYFFGPWLNIRQATQSVLTEAYLRDQYIKTHPDFTDHDAKRGTISTAGRVPAKTRSRWTGPEYYLTIEGQLKAFGLGEFEGRQHSGIDDAINVSRILTAISERDVIIEPNTQPLNPHHMKRWPWMGAPGVVKWEEWMSDSDAASRLTTVAPGKGPEKEWVLKENALGQIVAKKLPVDREKGEQPKDSEVEWVTRIEADETREASNGKRSPAMEAISGRGKINDLDRS